jgi:hypothetical protein
MTSRTCPDWPDLMEVAPELQFKHYTIREALPSLPGDALVHLDVVAADDEAICCDLDNHVFNPQHTDAHVGDALRASHWFELREWVARSRSDSAV